MIRIADYYAVPPENRKLWSGFVHRLVFDFQSHWFPSLGSVSLFFCLFVRSGDNSRHFSAFSWESFNSQGFVSDIDECNTGKWPCAEEATCNNQEGSFSCACPKGYHGDGEYFCEGKIRSCSTIRVELFTEGMSIGSWLNVVALGFSHFLKVLIVQQSLHKPLIWQIIFYIQAPCDQSLLLCS